jgi:hypothetical protein
MTRLFFLGAGASAADGYPVTRELMYPVAAYLIGRNVRNDPSRLFQYLWTVYGSPEATIAGAAASWKAFVDKRSTLAGAEGLPDIIELLSILDVAITDDLSFGPTPPIPKYPKIESRQLLGNELKRIRDRAIRALVNGFVELRMSGGRDSPNTRRFVECISGRDAVVTTNWDTLLDTALMRRKGQRVDYGSPLVTYVDANGDRVGRYSFTRKRYLFKLHGSLNWLYCSRCYRLYCNLALDVANVKDTCDCKGELGPLIITPSFLKTYQNVHIMNTWSRAQRALERSAEWYFVGYSFPTDDLWIRTTSVRQIS